MKRKILITGAPGIGKTTLIKRLSSELEGLQPTGFYTEEIREQGVRKGFELAGLNGRRGLLAHVDLRSPYRVSKYKVNVRGFEDFLDTIPFSHPSSQLIIIDEIGKMECLSERFRNLLKEILESDRWVIATIALQGSGWIEEIKRREDVKLVVITEENRNGLPSEILKEIVGSKDGNSTRPDQTGSEPERLKRM